MTRGSISCASWRRGDCVTLWWKLQQQQASRTARLLTGWCKLQSTLAGIIVADPDPGSGIGFFRIPDLGSRIPNPYFWELSDNFLGKKFYNSLKIGQIFFLQHFKNKIDQFCEIYGSKKRYDNKFFFTTVFHCCFWIRDPGSEIRDPGSGIRDG